MPGRIENLTPWQPGQSGNPNGSSDRQKVTTRLRRMIMEKQLEGTLSEVWFAMAVGDEGLLKGRRPSYAFFRELLDRIEGKLPERLEAQVAAAMPRPIFERIDNPRDKDLPPLAGDGPPALDAPDGDGEAS
jgi:hypothetical protein